MYSEKNDAQLYHKEIINMHALVFKVMLCITVKSGGGGQAKIPEIIVPVL